MVENLPKSSMADILKIELMPDCSCGQEKAVNFCKQKNCPQNKTQPYYCILCMQKDEVHDHKSISISKETGDQMLLWNTLKDQHTSLLTKATKIQEPYKSLISMCERLMISAPRNQILQFRSLTLDLKNLKKACDEFQKLYTQTISPMLVKCKLLELLQLANSLAERKQNLEPFKYLSEVSEDTIWEFYKPAIQHAILNQHEQGEVDQTAKETLQRMRFSWLNSRVVNLENALQGGQITAVSDVIRPQASQQIQESDMDARVSNVESKLKMCEHFLSHQVEEQKQINAQLQNQLQQIMRENEQSFREQKNYYENNLSAAQEENKIRLLEERQRSESQHQREIEKMMQEIKMLKEPILTKNVFKDSAILTSEERRRFVISLFVGEVFNAKITRLYQASQNGFEAAKFHSFCDNKGPSLTLIHTAAGHIFGGFTTTSWDSSNAYKNDTQSFLFSFDKKTKYPIDDMYYQFAIFCHPSFGPTFGNGHDIHVSNNSNQDSSSQVGGGYAYKIPQGANGDHSILTNGNKNFRPKELEVYLVH